MADGPVQVLLRPEQLRLGRPDAAAVAASVRGVDFYGHDSRVRLDLAGGPTVSARLEGTDIPSAGQDVSIAVLGAALPFPAGPAPVGQAAVDRGPASEEQDPAGPARADQHLLSS